MTRPCSVHECDQPSRARQMCISHYNQWRTNPHAFDPMTVRRRLALGESRALRLLVRAHGYIPRCAPTDWRAS